MKRKQCLRSFAAFAMAFAALAMPAVVAQQAHHPPKAPSSVRLYVFDCGVLQNFDPEPMFGYKKGELAVPKMSVACYLIVHPRGTLVWDTGIIADSLFKGDGQPVRRGQVVEATKPLLPQLAEIGYTPADIKYVALSHYHSDHSANLQLFKDSTWIVRQNEYEAVFSGTKAHTVNLADFAPMKESRKIVIPTAQPEYDVFGDGKVIIKFAPGHTPGHQVLYVDLKKTGGVVLTGDMYHFPEDRAQHRFQPLEENLEQAKASRADVEAFAEKHHAQVWIQHDFTANSHLKKSPDFYE